MKKWKITEYRYQLSPELYAVVWLDLCGSPGDNPEDCWFWRINKKGSNTALHAPIDSFVLHGDAKKAVFEYANGKLGVVTK